MFEQIIVLKTNNWGNLIPGVQIPVALCLNLAYLSQSPDIGLSSKLYKKENSIESKKKPLTKQKQLLDQIHTNETYRCIECPASASDRHRVEGYQENKIKQKNNKLG